MKPNIFCLSIDSLTQDKCLGKSKTSVTPNLDKLIQNGTFFNQIFSTAPVTMPSLSSIFTGLYPFECTTIDDMRDQKGNLFNLNQNLPTFSDDLRKSGYNTYAIIPQVLRNTNFSKLFGNVEFFNSFVTLYDENLGNKILNKLRQDVESPWFLFTHIDDLHGGYLQMMHEENYPGSNQYDKMLSAIDPWLGKIFQCIDLENTICVITSDHGSILADFTNEMNKFWLENDRLRGLEPGIGFNSAHKIVTNFPKKLTPLRKKMAKIYTKYRYDKVKKKLEPHAENLNLSPYQERLIKKVHFVNPSDCFDEGFRSTLILLGPNLPSGKIISKQISSIDIFPTILDLVKISTKINHRGKSLVPLFSNTKNDERVVMIDSASDGTQEQSSNTIGLRTEQYKYFRDRFSDSKDVHLYDLENDPFELSNISEQNPDIIENLEGKLLQINPTGNFGFKKDQEFSDEEAKKIENDLKKLGYIN